MPLFDQQEPQEQQYNQPPVSRGHNSDGGLWQPPVRDQGPVTPTNNQGIDYMGSNSGEQTKNGLYEPGSQVENNPADVTVENRLTGLLEKDNPYLKVARSQAQQFANARGLQNSSIAASAGEKAAIESALPIAQQDAGYYQSRGLNEQQGQIQKNLYETQGDISSKLSSQGFEQDMALKQADIEWNKIDLNARMQVEYDRMDQENKNRFDSTVSAIAQSYQDDYLTIMSDPNYASDADRQKAIDLLNKITQNRFKIAGQIAGVQLDWSGDGSANLEGI